MRGSLSWLDAGIWGLVGLVALNVGIVDAAGLYRWAAPNGTVQYGDAPPPGALNVVLLSTTTAQAMPTKAAPPSLSSLRRREATAQTIVPPDVIIELFTTDCGAVCQMANTYLSDHGLGYRAIDPSTDDASREAFLKASPTSVVPTLLIQKANGETSVVNGFNSGDWYDHLKKAGITFPPPGTNVPPPAMPSKP